MKAARPASLIACLLALALAGCQRHEQNAADQTADGTAAQPETALAMSSSAAIMLADNDGADYTPTIDAANFVATIDHPFLTLAPGRIWIYEGQSEDGETERVEIEVTNEKKTILGVATTVVREREWENGELVEDTHDWFAQDKQGQVWYFGEDSKEIENGEVVSTAGSWEAGVNGAKPGIVMKAQPQPGDRYRQEFLKGEAEDMGEVLSLDDSVTIGLGTFAGCLRIKDWSPLEPEVVEHKFYSRAVGNLILEKKVAGETGQMELREMKFAAAAQ